jgi:hypothetical protein
MLQNIASITHSANTGYHTRNIPGYSSSRALTGFEDLVCLEFQQCIFIPEFSPTCLLHTTDIVGIYLLSESYMWIYILINIKCRKFHHKTAAIASLGACFKTTLETRTEFILYNYYKLTKRTVYAHPGAKAHLQ